jgi:hypothetical protein
LRVEPLEGRWVPATITPTTFADGGLGSGSLRDAVLQFNANSGTDDDIIQLLPGTYTLTIRNAGGRHETAGFTGDLNLTQTSHRWIIQGAGPSTMIDASQLQDRVFQIVNPGTPVVFRDLVIQGGLAQEDGTDGTVDGTTDALGGGIFNNGGDVTFDDVSFQKNVALGARGANGGIPHAGYNAQGGGIYSTGGTLSISHSTLAHNQAGGGNGGNGTLSAFAVGGQGGMSQGGGLYVDSGALTLTDSRITANTLTGGNGGLGGCVFGEDCAGGGNGGATRGGGLYVASNNLTLTNATVTANTLTGGNGAHGNCALNGCGATGHGGASQGGAIYVSGMLSATDVTISANTLHGGGGSRGDASAGGGLYVNGTATLSSSMIAANSLSAGDNGSDAQGGGLYVNGTATLRNSTITANILSAGDGGGNALGGGMYSTGGALTISDSTLAINGATGGVGSAGYDYTVYGRTFCVGAGPGGNSQGGGLYSTVGALTISGSTLANNQATGGPGGTGLRANTCTAAAGNGGSAQGGGLYAGGRMLSFEDSTGAGNTAAGGAGGNSLYGNSRSGGGGAAQGGGLSVAAGATARVSFGTIAANQSTGGTHGNGIPTGSDGPATAGGLYNQGMVRTSDTILAGNMVRGPGTNTSPDLAGDLGSLGYNLIGNTQGGSGYKPTDLLDIDPVLGPLQDNGGPTETMALLPGSPALNAGDPSQLGTADQRGVVRTRGVNIGAYQASASAFVLTAPDRVTSGVPFDVSVTAVDPFGQVAVGYLGTITFSSNDPDPGVVLPADYSFQPSDGGQVTFPDGVTLITPGDQTLTVTDTVDHTIAGNAIITVGSPGTEPHGHRPPPTRLQVIPAQTAPPTQSGPPACEVIVLEQWIVSFHDSDYAWLSMPRHRGPARVWAA